MSERFFLSMPPRDGRAVLVGDEARHLARVMRCAVGDEVVVFDGSGTAWRARVASIGRDEVMLDMGEAVTASRLTRVPLTLAVALPKGERQKWLVEKLTELGVERLVPLATVRGVAEATPAAVERLSRGVVGTGGGAVLLVADRDGAPLEEVATGASLVVALVGPEGGFTEEELATIEAAGGRRVSLGPHVLRVETAAIALAARLA